MSAYAELAVTTNFSFLRGASHPQEMVARADELGLAAIGIADRNSFAGVVRAYDEAKKRKIKLLVGVAPCHRRRLRGARLSDRSPSLWTALPASDHRQSQSQERRMPSDLRRNSGASEGQIFIALPPKDTLGRLSQRTAFTHWLATRRRAAPSLPACIIIAATSRAGSACWPNSASEPARRSSPSTTCFYHAPERRPLADVLTCIREKCTIAEAGLRLAVNAERHLKPPEEMARLFASFPDAIARTLEIAEACRFSLDELQYEYPDEPVPPGKTAQQHLEDLTWAGAQRRYPKDRYPDGIPDEVRKRLDEELALIAKLDYARYFLTVHDIVAYAREQRNSLPGPRFGGQQRGLLLPRHHRGQSERDRTAVRPLHFGRIATSRPISTSISSTSGARR